MCKCYNNPIILQFFLSDSGEVIQDQETSRQSLEAQAGTVQAGSVTAPVLPGGSERQSQRGNVLTCRRHCTHIHRIHRHRIHHQAESQCYLELLYQIACCSHEIVAEADLLRKAERNVFPGIAPVSEACCSSGIRSVKFLFPVLPRAWDPSTFAAYYSFPKPD